MKSKGFFSFFVLLSVVFSMVVVFESGGQDNPNSPRQQTGNVDDSIRIEAILIPTEVTQIEELKEVLSDENSQIFLIRTLDPTIRFRPFNEEPVSTFLSAGVDNVSYADNELGQAIDIADKLLTSSGDPTTSRNDLKDKLEQLKQELALAKKNLKDAQSQLQNARDEAQKLNQAKNRGINAEDNFRKTEKQLKIARDENRQLRKEVEDCKQELFAKESEIEKKQQELEKVRNQLIVYKQERDETNRKSMTLLAQVEAGKQEIERKDRQIMTLEDEKQALQRVADDNQKLQAMVQKLQQENASLQRNRNRLDVVEGKVAELTLKLETCEQDRDETKKANTTLITQIEELEQEISTEKGEIKNLQQKLADSQVQLEKANAEAQKSKDEVQELQEEVKNFEQELELQKKQTVDREKMVEELKAKLKEGQPIPKADSNLRLIFRDSILFDTGEYQLTNEDEDILRQVAKTLKEESKLYRSIQIYGHTDTDEYDQKSIGEFPSDNWELSCARALAVLKFLEDPLKGNIEPEHLSASAYGPYRTMKENGVESKDASRRVEIFLVLP